MEKNELEYRLDAIGLLVNKESEFELISDAIAQIRYSLGNVKEKEVGALHRIHKSHLVTVSLRDHAGSRLMADLISHPIHGQVCSNTGSFRHPMIC